MAARADVFRAVADPTRRNMLDLLRESERSVGELAEPFRMSQPAISQHLKILRDAGLVRGRQVGRQRLYRLDAKPLQDLFEWAARHRVLVDPFGHAFAFAPARPVRSPRASDEPAIARVLGASVFVRDSDKAVRFYVGKLGFEARGGSARRRWIEVAPRGSTIGIALHTAPRGRRFVAGACVLACRDVDATIRALRLRGVRVTDDPASIRDPDGNRLILVDDGG